MFPATAPGARKIPFLCTGSSASAAQSAGAMYLVPGDEARADALLTGALGQVVG
jgi:hypothetical protein